MTKESPVQSILPLHHLDAISFNMISLNRSYMILENSPDYLIHFQMILTLTRTLTRLPTSKYMIEKEINDQLCSFNKKSMFSILHLNDRSWLKSLGQRNFILKNLKRAFSNLGVSET